MSVFLLPTSLCKEINRMMQRFWWGHKENLSKIHWMSWERMGAAKNKGGLGFRDLTIFNKALLAKQVWRLSQNPDSLAAKIFKAKYHGSCTILEAKVGNKPSLVWRSFMKAQEIIIRGAIWRVGDGKSIKVKGDRWLPTPVSFSVQSPCSALQGNSRVAELIDYVNRRWNVPLIEANFTEEEAEVIKNIPLSPCLPRDRLIWRGTKNGIFTVRSAYHMEVERQALAKGECSNPGEEEEAWKVCWHLNIPNAAKMFLWRACHNLLPTKMNLVKRGVIKEGSCPIYLRADETVEHALWECPSASDVWSSGPVSLQKSGNQGGVFLTLFGDIRRRCIRSEVELFVITARRVWLRRNDVVHGGAMTHPAQVMRDAQTALEDFQRANGSAIIEVSPERHIDEIRWTPPPETMIKINFDATLNGRYGTVGLGILARDAGGRVQGAYSVTLKVTVLASDAEALAALYAVFYAKERNFSGVLFEGDAQVIVNAMNSLQPCNSSYGHFIEDARRGLRELGHSRFIHVKREANVAAHYLARAAGNHATGTILWHCIPSCIDGVVRKESVLTLP
jgi:ribonuclease HI